MKKKSYLVTGGSGFLGLHLILQLLNQGEFVRTTLRSLEKQAEVIATLKKAGAQNLDKLEFVQADLLSDDGWQEAMTEIEGVFSVASPVFFGKVTNPDEIIETSRLGIQRILHFAKGMHVKRVVMTSNFGAVGFSEKAKAGGVTTERNWTNESEKGLSIYEKSKLLAEKEAWGIANQPETTFEFVTVNPVAIFGPSLNAHTSGSVSLITNLLDGSMKRVPQIPLNIVDVRDVASAHVLAMMIPKAAGNRFILSAAGMITLTEIAQMIKKDRPLVSQKVSGKKLPDWVIHIGATFNQHAAEGELLLHMNRVISTENAQNILGWKSQYTNAEIVLNTVDSLAI
ncbi:MAG: NAD-dependent epimerase/dehydratase family protein [Enterococcus sp.]